MATIKDLKFDEKNFNKHTGFGMSLLEKSLRQNGAGRSILLDKDNNIIAGNGIVEAAGSVGLENVKIVEATGNEIIAVKRTDISLDSKQGREMALADNATAAADLEWDREKLQSEFEASELEQWGIDTGDWAKAEEAQEDEPPEVNDKEPASSKLGEIYQLGDHRLMCGDSTSEGDVALLMNGQKADMVFTDPPYGVSYTEKNEYFNSLGGGHRLTKAIENDSKTPEQMYEFWVQCFKLLHQFTNGTMTYYVTAPQGGDLLQLMQALRDSGFMPRHQLVWNKNNHVLGRCDYNYKHEPIIYGWKIGGKHNFYGKGKFKTSVWDIPKPLKNDLHPTMKPVELIANAMLDATIEGQAVIDLFGGSGSTLIACEQLGRKAYLMELDPHYCDVIRKRYWKFAHGSEEGWEDGTKAIA